MYSGGRKYVTPTKEILSKMAFLKWAWQTLKVLPRPQNLGNQQPDIRAFQWGTTQSCILRGCKTAGRQSWRSKKSWYFGFEATFFAILCSNRRGPGSIPGRGGLWGPAALQPLDLQGCIIPHLKALTHTILGLEAQGRVSIFRVRHALLKTAILLSNY